MKRTLLYFLSEVDFRALPTNQCKEKIQLTKLQRLKKEEEVLKKVLKKYQDGLHALQIEELTIKYELGKRRTHDNDTLNNSVPQSIADFKTFISVEIICKDLEWRP
ncbi:uncharacterized protein LOC123504740 isoform X4 [Portunus trituberculatus]|uniref:uncharacterized protein LOC123504740 isoform X4 n=1 Tax=Portunus trituberculatus TaxID=210409 RepID=UPI001E1CD8E9|nr:uncharacterized protein LOC123504740 isoform X4 [Portunus trituberculatus]